MHVEYMGDKGTLLWSFHTMCVDTHKGGKYWPTHVSTYTRSD